MNGLYIACLLPVLILFLVYILICLYPSHSKKPFRISEEVDFVCFNTCHTSAPKLSAGDIILLRKPYYDTLWIARVDALPGDPMPQECNPNTKKEPIVPYLTIAVTLHGDCSTTLWPISAIYATAVRCEQDLSDVPFPSTIK